MDGTLKINFLRFNLISCITLFHLSRLKPSLMIDVYLNLILLFMEFDLELVKVFIVNWLIQICILKKLEFEYESLSQLNSAPRTIEETELNRRRIIPTKHTNPIR